MKDVNIQRCTKLPKKKEKMIMQSIKLYLYRLFNFTIIVIMYYNSFPPISLDITNLVN